jgi:hypothetical protein
MERHDEDTPIGRPLTLGDVNTLKAAMHGLESAVLALHQQMRPLVQVERRVRTSVYVCVLSAVVCVGAVLAKFS